MNYKAKSKWLTDIASAIRLKKGTTELILYENFPSEILSITGNITGSIVEAEDDGVWYRVTDTELTAIADAIRQMRGTSSPILFDNFVSEILAIDMNVPDHITITTVPTTLVYNDGDTIDFTGLVVIAYCEDGSLWTYYNSDGSIPHSALTFPVTVAEYTE